MPISDISKHKIENNSIQIITWDITENTEVLLKNITLNDEEKSALKSLNQKRKKEFLAIRNILKYLNIDESIWYKNTGKPYLKNTEISISHSREKVVLAISKNEIGVDIEMISDRILKVKNKFTSLSEREFIPSKTEIEYFHIIWGIKECLYKIHGGKPHISFSKNIRVEPFFLCDNKVKSSIEIDGKTTFFEATFELKNGFCLAYAFMI